MKMETSVISRRRAAGRSGSDAGRDRLGRPLIEGCVVGPESTRKAIVHIPSVVHTLYAATEPGA